MAEEYRRYVDAVEEAGTLDELAELVEEIRVSPELSEGEKHSLISTEIGRVRKAMARKESKKPEAWIYKSEVNAALERLPVTPELREILDFYWLVYCPPDAGQNYSNWTTLRKSVLPYIRRLIEWLAEQKGRVIGVEDFDILEFKPRDWTKFLISISEKPSVRIVVHSFIQTFGKYLVNEGYITNFSKAPKGLLKKERVPEAIRLERKEGIARSLSELQSIFAVVSTPTPRISRRMLPVFKLFFETSLATGCRPGQLLNSLRFSDLVGAEVDEDALGRRFYKIPYSDIVAREKAIRGEFIEKKMAAPYIYLEETLRNRLLNLQDLWDCGIEGYVFGGQYPIPLRTLQQRAITVQRMTGIPNFSLYDFRATWASILYGASGNNLALVVTQGGWSAADIPVGTYTKAMDPPEAVRAAEYFGVYIDQVATHAITAIRETALGEERRAWIEQERERMHAAIERKRGLIVEEMKETIKRELEEEMKKYGR